MLSRARTQRHRDAVNKCSKKRRLDPVYQAKEAAGERQRRHDKALENLLRADELKLAHEKIARLQREIERQALALSHFNQLVQSHSPPDPDSDLSPQPADVHPSSATDPRPSVYEYACSSDYHQQKLTSFTNADLQAFTAAVLPTYLDYNQHGLRRVYQPPDTPGMIADAIQLWCVLLWLRQYPTYVLLSAIFGVNTHDIGHILYRGVQVLREYFGDRPDFPSDKLLEAERDKWASALPDFLKGAACVVDGSEFKIPRPASKMESRFYSYKKHQHALNLLFIVAFDGRILWWSPKQDGPPHDQSWWNSCGLRENFEGKDFGIIGDGGYYFNRSSDTVRILGFKPTARHPLTHESGTVLAKKGLTPEEKEDNTKISHWRVIVEDSISSLKILRVFKSVFRHHSSTDRTNIAFDDVMTIGVNLTNMRLKKSPLRPAGWE